MYLATCADIYARLSFNKATHRVLDAYQSIGQEMELCLSHNMESGFVINNNYVREMLHHSLLEAFYVLLRRRQKCVSIQALEHKIYHIANVLLEVLHKT